MVLQFENNIALYIVLGLLFVIIVVFIYFLIQNRAQKLAKKILEEEIESEGYKFEEKKKPIIEKKLLDEITFFVGVTIAIIGFIIRNYIILVIGITVSAFSVYLLHIMLISEKQRFPFHKKFEMDSKTERMTKIEPMPKKEIMEEDKQLLKKKLSTTKISVIKEKKQSKEHSNEIKKFLNIIDNLLEKLPEDEISAFSNSKDFELYKKVMQNPPKNIDDDLKKLAPIIDDLLEKLPENEISKFSKSKDFKLYKSIMSKLI